MLIQTEIDLGNSYNNAVLSEDRIYRYALRREWAAEGLTVAFICLNPSTADENNNDPTVRRCIGFAKSWGGARLIIGNLFAFRATSPDDMRSHQAPIGPENDYWLNRIAGEADILIAAWGAGEMFGRDKIVKERFAERLMTLRITKHGFPAHPLYLPSNLTPIPY